mgnify:CR=1 FL=1
MIRNIRWVLLACLVVAGVSAFAEGERSKMPKANEEKRDAKLAEGWLKKAPWILDYDKAREEAKASGKPLFAYFTRSYAY